MEKKLLFLVLSFFVLSVFSQTAPTGITISSLTVDEDLDINTEVGTFTTTDADSSDTFTYTLVAGTGDTNNTSFTISDDKLQTAEVFDFETKASYDIRVETNDGTDTFSDTYRITVNDINDTPTAIALSSLTVDENSAINSEVGTLTTTDADSSDTFTYALVAGTGDTNNASFTISDDILQTTEVFDFETKSSYDIRLETNDGTDTFSDTYTITINDINDTPTAISLSSLTVDEDLDEGTEVGAFTTTDADAANTFTYALVAGEGDTNNASFTISNDKLLTAEAFDFETKASYEIRVETNDGASTFSKTYTIAINDTEEVRDVSGIISSNTTWRAANNPYNVVGNIQVTEGVNLTIESGVIVNYAGDKKILVNGNLNINGTELEHVQFNGNNVRGTQIMILFQSTNLDNSAINYVDFTGPQKAIQLADESSNIQDDTKNTNTLNVAFATFTNTEVATKGYFTSAKFVIANSTFNSSEIKGYQSSEGITLNTCKVDGSKISSNRGNRFKIYNSEITEATFYINNSYSSRKFSIEDSKIYNSKFSGYRGNVVINKSILVDSPLYLPQNNVAISNSVISFDGSLTPEENQMEGTSSSAGIYTLKATITNTLITGRGSGVGVEIYDSNNYESTISTSVITNNAIGIKVRGNQGVFDFQNNNFTKNKEYALENQNNKNITASNNYWGTTEEIAIEALIYHNVDDTFSNIGTVNFKPFASTYEESTVILPPLNVAKVPSGADVVLTWTSNPEATVTGYKLHYGDPTGLSYTNVIDLGNVNTYTIAGGAMDTEYALTAYTATANGNNDQIEGVESWFTVAKEPKVSLSVLAELVTETVGDVIITAAMETVLPYDTTVTLSIAGTANATDDYTITATTITIPSGALSSTATISVVADELVEYDETIIIDIDSVTNATENGEQQVTLTVENTNKPTITLVTSETSIAEKETFTITANIDAPISKDIFIDFASTGLALYSTDFTSNSATRIQTVAGGNGYGSAQNQLYNPFADSSDNIYIADISNNRIQKWASGATEGETVISGVDNPTDVFVDDAGTIYVLEQGKHQVTKWISGASSGEIVAGGNGEGDAANQLDNPQGLFVDTAGNIYIADQQNHRIQKWTPNATEGITVAGGNDRGSAQNQLNYPSAIFLDELNNVFVADSSNDRIQKWLPGATKGETVVSEVSYPSDVTVDAFGNIYIAEVYNHQVTKWVPGASIGEVVAGGNGSGNDANQLSYPNSFFVNEVGTIYVADTGNSRIQKYQSTPQVIIKTGETSATLLFSGTEDTRDEDDESIILNTTASNAILESVDPIEVALTDINEPPTIEFTFSEDKIAENSPTDVTFTATLSSVSAKDVAIDFTMEGSAAENTDYVVSEKTISILANAASGTITISSEDLDDAVVEVLDSIVFKVKTISNASALKDRATLFLESDDDPNVVVTVSQETIAEHETFNVIATLDAASSKDVVVALASEGTALYDGDFKRNTAVKITTVAGGNGSGNATNQLYNPRGVFVDAIGNLFIADYSNERIQKWASGATEGERVISSYVSSPTDVFADVNGNIYLLERSNSRVRKWAPDATEGITVAGGNSDGTATNQLSYPKGFYVDELGNIFIADTNNHRIQKWAPDATEGITVAGGNEAGNGANQLSSPHAIFVDAEGNLFIADTNNNRIQKWAPNATEGETVLSGIGSPVDIQLDSKENIYVLDQNNQSILKYPKGLTEGIVVAGGNGNGSEPNQFSNAYNFTVDAVGNVYVSDYSNHRIQKYEASLQVKVKAGETIGRLTLAGIEDELNAEGAESIVIKTTGAQNATLEDAEDLSVTLLDNTKTLALKDSPFMGLSAGAVSWGDYDRDGDKDVAIMGQSNTLGAVTLLYENKDGAFVNTNQNFSKLYGGDITWVDLNKDGWIDIVVSGFDGTAPQTKVYINNKGTSFEPTNGYGLPQLFSTKMAWGDLDNDGDIDLAISGQNADDNYVFDIYYKEDFIDNFVKETQFSQSGFINGDLKIVDIDLDGDNDIIYNGENSSGSPTSNIIYNSYINGNNTNNNWELSDGIRLKNSAIEVVKLKAGENNALTIITSGEDSGGTIKLSVRDFSYNYWYDSGTNADFPLLKNGDISVADFNNDGTNDIVFTGENEQGVPVTKLFKQVLSTSNQEMYYEEMTSTQFKDTEIELKGLRASTATWVDYDMDGDLDLFLTGIGSSGAETLLYETEIANKKNAAPEKIAGLVAEDLGNGKIRFKWDLPADDYATNLGYVLRVGTTAGGTELSNTESDLSTGVRLISKAPPIYNNFYDMQLDPGNYYWSVQAVDPGLKGSEFSEEDAFTLAYEWKILNQGGIVDRTVSGVSDPILKLGDVDNDNDLDVIYGSETEGQTQLLKFDGKQLIKDNQSPLQYVSNVTNSEVGDINGDGIADILVNTAQGFNYQLTIYLSNGEVTEEVSAGINTNYYQQNVGQGLYNAKARIIDLNNDGQAEIFLAGMSSSSISGIPKLYVYEYNSETLAEADNFNGTFFTLNDVSDQIEPLQSASYDLGDIDNDQDIDFIISGFTAGSGIKSFIYENVTELGGEFTLEKTSNNLVAVKNGTTDLIDFDSDGDLDAVFTGESKGGDVFEIYMNKLNEGITEWPRLANGLSPMREGKIDLGDFNGDGYTDLLYSGTFEGTGDITKLSEYNSATKTYVESGFDVSDIVKAEVEFGDLDGDGDLDFVIAGKSNVVNGGNIFRTYINVRNQSAEVLAGKGAAKRPKYRGKNAAKYANATFTVNAPPSVPVVNDITFLEESDGSVDIPLEFSWQAATDDHTPSVGLTYAIKIGTTAGAEDIMSSNSNTNGIKKDAEKGNVEHNLKWKLSLPEGTYYYSVQAVDASYSGSAFTEAVQFKVTAAGIDSDTDSDGIENSLDLCPNTPKGDAVDTDGCTVNAILGDANGNTEVSSSDLVVSVNYILGNNPVPFVFKAADVNNDDEVDVRDIVGIVDLVLNAALGKNNGDSTTTPYYSKIPIGEAIFSWEGNDLYVSTDKAIAGMQLVFDKDFTYKLSDNLANFNIQNFSKDNDNTLMVYSFSEISITPGKTKLLTKYEDDAIILNVEKSSTGALEGLTLTVAFKPNVLNQLEPFILGPNPSSGQMNLFYNVPKETDALLLKVYNVNGAKVWSSNKINNILGAQKTPLDLSSLSDGIYFMRIEEYSKGALQNSEVKRLIIKK